MIDLMREIETIARAYTLKLDQDVLEQSLDFIDKAAPHIRASMQLDIQAGRQSEIESMVGIIGRRAVSNRSTSLPGETCARATS